jgi:hypothetical protein
MINNLIKKYGIHFLVILYLVINIIYKNLINIVIFLMAIALTINLFSNKINSIILAYIISISYGIINNFHLLENFKVNKIKESEKPIKLNENLKLLSIDNELKEQKNDMLKQTMDAPNIKSLISTRLVNKFMNQIKEQDNTLVTYKSININSFKPTISELNSKKIKDMLDILSRNKIISESYIVLSNDYFIIDGHHRWYSNKIYNENNGKEENIKVIIIDLPLKNLIKKMKEYKIEYNENIYKKFELSNNDVQKANECIKNIKNNILYLEKYHNHIQKIKLV